MGLVAPFRYLAIYRVLVFVMLNIWLHHLGMAPFLGDTLTLVTLWGACVWRLPILGLHVVEFDSYLDLTCQFLVYCLV